MRSIAAFTRYGGSRRPFVVASTLFAAAGTLHASDASACSPTTDPNCVCSFAQPTWNAPAGAVVFERSQNSELRPLFDALGEYRTHTMMSTGPGQMAVHNTAQPSQAGSPSCNTPASGPSFSQPGLMAVQQADIFGSMFTTSNGQLTGPDFLAFQVPMQPGFAAAFLSEIAQITNAVTNEGGLGGVAQGGPNGPQFQATWLGNQFTYDFHSFIDGAMLGMGEATPFVNLGSVSPFYTPGNGGVCSSAAAFMQTRTFLDQGVTYAGGWVQPKTYPHSLLYQGGTLGNGGNDLGVAQTLFNSIYAQEHTADSFWGALKLAGFAVGCDFGGIDVFANAANQALNCVANQGCGDGNPDWVQQVVSPTLTATSITDDTLGGWNGGPVWETLPGQPPEPREGASVWAGGTFQQVQWSGEGTSVVCMDMPTPPQGPTGSTPTGDVTPTGFILGDTPWVAITEIFPMAGPSVGGTVVTIQGAQFSTTPGATQVYFGGWPATNVHCTSPTLCTATTPQSEYPNFNTTADVEVIVGGQDSKSAPLAPTFPFHYSGTGGPTCTQSFWTCDGSNEQVDTAYFQCDIPAQAPYGGYTYELLQEINGAFVPVASTTSEFGGVAGITQQGFVPSPSPTTTNYEVCMQSTLGTACTSVIPLNTWKCTCYPNTCDSISACNGTYADGCGGTINCGDCPTGETCSTGSGTGFPTGTCFTPTTKGKGGGGGCKGTTCM
jgi:hypothetical protein